MALYFDPTPTDREQLAARGITEDEADRQLGCLRRGFAPVPLVRPATPGDGIEVVVAHRADRLIDRWRKAAREGRLSRFVPASGAASRMFNLLEQFRADEIDRDPGLDQFFDGRRDFAFAGAWQAACREAGVDFDSTGVVERRRMVDILLGDEGLAWPRFPRGSYPSMATALLHFVNRQPRHPKSWPTTRAAHEYISR